MNERSANIRLSWIFSGISVLLLVASSYFFLTASSAGKTSTRHLLAAQCLKEFEAIGVKSNIRPQDHAIVSYQPGVDLMQDRVNASSIVIGRCVGYRLVEFCAGNGCAKPGVFFVLETI